MKEMKKSYPLLTKFMTKVKEHKKKIKSHSKRYGDCVYCGGKVEEQLLTYEVEKDDELHTIENVPMGVCIRCGEKVIKPAVCQNIEEIIETKKLEAIEETEDSEIQSIESPLIKGDSIQEILDRLDELESEVKAIRKLIKKK